MNADLKRGTPCVEQSSAVTPTGAALSARATWSDAGQFGRVRMVLSICAAVGSAAPRRFGSTIIRLCANSFAGRESLTDWRRRILCYRSIYSAAPVGLSSPSAAPGRRHRTTTPALASPRSRLLWACAPWRSGQTPVPSAPPPGNGCRPPRPDYGQLRPLLTARTLACDPGSWRIGASARGRGFR